jgi:signal transduction histidine kinase
MINASQPLDPQKRPQTAESLGAAVAAGHSVVWPSSGDLGTSVGRSDAYTLREQAVFVYGTGLAIGLHLALLQVFIFREWRVIPMIIVATLVFCTASLALWHSVFPRTSAWPGLRRLAAQLLLAGLVFAALSVAFTEIYAWLTGGRGLFEPYTGGDQEVKIAAATIRWAPLVFTLIPIVPTALICVVGFNQHWWRIFVLEGRQRELRELAVASQLSALRAQVNPHFFFNSLNSIAQLISSDPDKAERCVERLADIYRYILSRSQAEFVSLAEEIEVAEAYLEIEKARFGDDLIVEEEIEDGARPVRLPGLILQPLIENAVKHGISRKIGGGTVRIRAALENGHLRLTVADTGDGISERERVFERGVGLRNVRDRLVSLYGADYTPHIDTRPGEGTTVTLRIPVGAEVAALAEQSGSVRRAPEPAWRGRAA